MQQCDFEVELIIADDCSPDNTESVVDSFKQHENFTWIKYTKHEVNKGANENFMWAFGQATGKYIALCEGDDNWTDPYKLQKQVDFLEAHEEYVCVGGKVKILDTRNENNKMQYGDQYFEYSHNQKVPKEAALDKVKLSFHTSTFLFVRNGLDLDLFESLFKYSISGDVPLLNMLNAKGSIYYINDVFGVNNHNNGGITNMSEHKGINFLWNRVYMWEQISKLYEENSMMNISIDNQKYFNIIFFRKFLNLKLTDQIVFYRSNKIRKPNLVKAIIITLIQKVFMKLRLKR